MESKSEKFNSNNAWGFGGGIGTQITYENGYYVRKGRAYYRHLKPESFTTYYNPEGKRISREAFLEMTK